MTTQTTKENTSHINSGAAFRLCNSILDKWGCSTNEKQAILRLTKSSYHRYKKDNDSASLSSDQLERISYIANIHQTLRLVFSNPDNVYTAIKETLYYQEK